MSEEVERELMRYSTKLNHREVFEADARTEVSLPEEPKSAFDTEKTPELKNQGSESTENRGEKRRNSVFGSNWGMQMLNKVADGMNLLNQERKRKMHDLKDYIKGPADEETLFDREEALAEVAKERQRMEKPRILPKFHTGQKFKNPRKVSTNEPYPNSTSQLTYLGENNNNEKAPPTYLEGYLHKKSERWMGLAGWVRKFIKLDGKVFTFYKPKSKTVFTGSLNFDLMTVILRKEEDKHVFSLHPSESSKVFYFKAESQVEFDQWYGALEYAINTSDGNKTSLISLFKEAKFWKYERIGPKDILSSADSGDILLFTSPAGMAGVQRVFSGSKYDHVGIFLVSTNPRQVFVLEATSNEGVGISLFSDFVKYKWYKLYQRLVIRKLKMENKKEFYKRLQNFVDHAHGKAYSINAAKFMKKTSAIGENEDFKDRTFFCSELVAAAYKRCGLLPKEKSSTQYWPGSFSVENDMKLEGGAELGPEYLIDFSAE